MILEHRHFSDIIDFLPDAAFVIDRAGTIVAWNKAMESLTGALAAEVVGRGNFEHAVPFYGKRIPVLADLVLNPEGTPGDQYDFVDKVNQTLIAEVFTPHLRPGGAYLWAKAAPLYDADGTLMGAIEIVRDISASKETEKALREQLHLLQVLLDAIPTPIFFKDDQGIYLGCNLAFQQCLGLPKDKILGRDVAEVASRKVAALCNRADQDLLRRQGMQTFESSLTYADGREHNVIFTKATFLKAEGAIGGLVGTMLDITELKRVEKALRDSETKLRKLSAQLLQAHEQERRRLSRELHDELGQTLNVLKLQISYIEKRLKRDQNDLKLDCEFLRQYMDEIIDSVRRISRDLSPSILEDLGLTMALQHLMEEFTRHYRIQIKAELPDLDRLVPQESRIHIYRIFQESLTNIAKHAGASQVTIKVQQQRDCVRFTIADNGNGFDPEQVADMNDVQKGLGLAAMDERVHMLGGALHIKSREGAGTKIGFSVKLSQLEKPAT